ncbi:MFS transporter [Alkalibaculum sp. M08DMB]|uniref:MFS transporter n=1 Tax=Alkalibaculum sporogenes TaxID=2655001 RepID=A0A6A7KA12_9FIRM|nr:MFS transporter [Alkalibaculum sporogenes]MPW26151.1 MFS transporter [Alkalibaculum sporogenes]
MSDQVVNESSKLTQQEVEDKKKLKLLKILWPGSELGGGFQKAFFGTYVTYLLTDVYVLSVVLAGMLQSIQTIVSWVFGPMFGTFLDRFSFKKSKFWPWILIGSTVCYGAYIILFSIPALGVDPKNLAYLAFFMMVVIAISQPIQTVSKSAIYPKISSDPKDRTFLATTQKIGRDGGKVIFGYMVPVMLIYFTATFKGVETSAYAITGLIIGVISLAFFFALAYGLRGSYVEREAMEEEITQEGKKKKIPMTVVLKTVFTNKALLTMFSFMAIHKTYYFFHLNTAAYFFQYYFKDFGKLALFMAAFNLSAVVGVMFGGLWIKAFKDSKRGFVASGICHIIFLGIITFTMKSLSANAFIILICGSSFFAGLLEAFIMPLFAGAADWGAWKYGKRQDGITMSIYSITITTGVLVSTVIRTFLMDRAGYDAAAYAAGEAPSAVVLNTLASMQSTLPFILSIICIAIVAFFYPLNDSKLAEIRDEMKLRKGQV